MTDMFHIKAIEVIARSLRAACENDPKGREDMALGQYIAGMGFSNVGEKLQYICDTYSHAKSMHNKGRHILCSDGGDMMRKFKIPSIPPTTNKCIRIPNDVIAGVEKAIRGRDCTFSAFVIEALRVALENLEEENGEHPDP